MLQAWRRAVVAGEFGGWTPIGAVQTASGYDVAWELPGANEYYGVEHRQQRQLHRNHYRRDGGNRLCAGVDRDDFQPRPERRWDDWSYQDGDPDRHQRVWIDQPDRGCQRIFSL